MSEPLILTLDECIRLNERLQKAVVNKMSADLIDIIDALSVSEVKGKLKNISESKLGSTVSKLCKFSDSDVSAAATMLKKQWQAKVDASRKNGAPSSATPPVKAEPPAEPKVETEVKSEAVPPQSSTTEAASSSDAASAAPKSGDGPVPLTTSSSFSVQWRPTAKTGDAVRDQVRTKLQDCFEKGKEVNAKFLREQSTDTAQMAEDAENHMIETFGGTGKEYKARFRSLVFNLSDPKNPDFIRSVLTGQLFVKELATMEVREMAGEELKKQRQLQAEHAKMALMDEKTYKLYAGKNTEDGILKCPRCKSMKTEYIEVQTRSADEPTTKKCTCNACDYRWKFC